MVTRAHQLCRADDLSWEAAPAHTAADRAFLWRAIGDARLRVQRMRCEEADVGGHLHDDGDQLFFVLSGEAIWLVDGDEITTQPGDALYVERGVTHQVRELRSRLFEYLLVHIPLTPAGDVELKHEQSEP